MSWFKAGHRQKDSKDRVATFEPAKTRENIISGEKHSRVFGKIAKYFADLKTVAFTGNFNDLSDKPTIPAAVAVKGNAETTYRTGNVNLTSANIGAATANHSHSDYADASWNRCVEVSGGGSWDIHDYRGCNEMLIIIEYYPGGRYHTCLALLNHDTLQRIFESPYQYNVEIGNAHLSANIWFHKYLMGINVKYDEVNVTGETETYVYCR